MTKKSQLWNDLFYGRQNRKNNGGSRRREGGLIDLVNKRLVEPSFETNLILQLLLSAGREEDREFMKTALPFCELLGLNYYKLMTTYNNIWELECL